MSQADPIQDYRFTEHALAEMARRGLTRSMVEEVLKQPGQRLSARIGRDVLQSRLHIGGTPYVLRVFVDVDRAPAEVVTAYRTSKVEKYWRSEP